MRCLFFIYFLSQITFNIQIEGGQNDFDCFNFEMIVAGVKMVTSLEDADFAIPIAGSKPLFIYF